MGRIAEIRDAARRRPGDNELEHFLAFFFILPLMVLLMAAIPLALFIGIPWAVMRDHGLAHLYTGMIAIPLGVVLFVGMWWLLATDRATWGDD
jgi:hypothetical protein